MRGEVEIWRGDTLISREPNMLVDGAGELLADIMTVSPSLSGVEDHATSSILDSSNYTIQAISFGTGSEAFTKNAHRQYPEGSIQRSRKLQYCNSFINGRQGIPSMVFEPSSTTTGLSVSGIYTPEVGLPIPPTPSLRTLENDTNVSAVIDGIAVSSVFPGNGQLTNFLPSSIMSSMMENTSFSSTIKGARAASILGCFPDGSSTNAGYSTYTRNLRIFSEVDDSNSVDNIIWTTVEAVYYASGGYFNEVSSMDVSGFVTMVMSGSPGTTTGYGMSSTASGLCLSGSTGDSSGYIEYSVLMSPDDVGHANAYGGIYHLGLWTIDMKQSLLNGNTPPFGFSVLNNPRKYKLFARKGLSKNLCYVENHTTEGDLNYTDLTIKWRLHFL